MAYKIVVGLLLILAMTPIVVTDLDMSYRVYILWTSGIAILHSIIHCFYRNILNNRKVASRFDCDSYMAYILITLAAVMGTSLMGLGDTQHAVLATLLVAGIIVNNLYLAKSTKILLFITCALYSIAFTVGNYWLLEKEVGWSFHTESTLAAVVTFATSVSGMVSFYGLVSYTGRRVGACSLC